MRATSLAVLLLLLLVSIRPLAVAADPASVGAPAPAFTLADAAGKTRSLAEFRGRYVVLEWVNFGCPFVRKHYDSGNMQDLQRSYTSRGVVWLSICSSAPGKQGFFEGKELRERIAGEKSSATAYLVDMEGKIGQAYGAKTTPHMYIINPEGTLIYAGGIDDKASTNKEDLKTAVNYVREALNAALDGKPVKITNSRPYGCSVKYK
jgi:peroxiredoxin